MLSSMALEEAFYIISILEGAFLGAPDGSAS